MTAELECPFCQIIAGNAPGQVIYRDEQVAAFFDTHPAAPIHILIVPIQHIGSVNLASDADEAILGHLFTVARKIAEKEGIRQGGYRLIVNNGPDAGQTIPHIHMHLLGGRRLGPLGLF